MRAPTRTTTVDMLSAEELQEEAARLLKHMSIGGWLGTGMFLFAMRQGNTQGCIRLRAAV